eukprot:6784346-Lingulodinium_polyedra.AAC.1
MLCGEACGVRMAAACPALAVAVQGTCRGGVFAPTHEFASVSRHGCGNDLPAAPVADWLHRETTSQPGATRALRAQHGGPSLTAALVGGAAPP